MLSFLSGKTGTTLFFFLLFILPFTLQYIANAPYYWYNPRYDCSWIWEGVEFNASAISQLLNVILEVYDFTQYFEKLKMPIFLALGRYDYVSPYYLWDNLIEKFSNLSYNLFEKSEKSFSIKS